MHHERFNKALKATGRKKLFVAGVTTEICVTFPVLQMLEEGYEAQVSADASAPWSKDGNDPALRRMENAGAVITTARVNTNHDRGDAVRARRTIEARCKRHLGQIVPVTYEKDWDMVLLLDDRARSVERDAGRVFCGHPRKDLKAFSYAIRRGRRRMNRW